MTGSVHPRLRDRVASVAFSFLIAFGAQLPLATIATAQDGDLGILAVVSSNPSVRVLLTSPADRTTGVDANGAYGSLQVTFGASDGTTGGSILTTGDYVVKIGGATVQSGGVTPTDGTWDGVQEEFTSGTYTPTRAGSVQICGRATDASGNTGEACATFTVIDDKAPSVRVASVSPDDTVVYGTGLVVAFAATDGTTGASSVTSGDYRIDDGAWIRATTSSASGAFGRDFSTATLTELTLPIGSHTICGRATDASGNTSTPSGDDCATVEVTGPVVRAVSTTPVGPVPFGTSIVARFSASDGSGATRSVSTGEYRVLFNGDVTQDWTAGIPVGGAFGGTRVDFTTRSYSWSRAGVARFCGRATLTTGDRSATTGESCISVSVTDGVAPSVQITSFSPTDSTTGVQPGGGYGLFSVTWSASDGTTGQSAITSGDFVVRKVGDASTSTLVTGAGWGDVTAATTQTYRPSTPGSYDLCLRVRDASGNTSALVCHTFTAIDDRAPSVRVVAVAPSSPVQIGTSFVVRFSATDGTTGGSSVTSGDYRVDGGNWTTGTTTATGPYSRDFSTATLTLPLGSHVVCARATDASGNTSSTSGDSCTTVVVSDHLPPVVRALSTSPTGPVPYGTTLRAFFSASDGTTGGNVISSTAYRVTFNGSVVEDWTAGIPALGGVSVSFSTGTYTWTRAGVAQFCGRATDAVDNTSGGTGESCISVSVTDGVAPSVWVTSFSPTDGTTGVAYQAFSVTWSASDGTTGQSALTSGDFVVRKNGAQLSSTAISSGDAAWGSVTETPYASYVPTSPGAYDLCLRVRDASGNTSQLACQSFTAYDDAPPSVWVRAPETATSITYGARTIVRYRADDSTTGGSGIASAEVQVDGAWQSGVPGSGAGSILDFSTGALVLGRGDHEICGRATDASGNTSLSSGDLCRSISVESSTSILYTGDTYDATSGGTNVRQLQAVVVTPRACILKGRVTFVVSKPTEDDPAGVPFIQRDFTSGSMTYAASATEYSTGTATWRIGSDYGLSLTDGVYIISVAFTTPDPANCDNAHDDGVLSIFARRGTGSTYGGGWYKVNNPEIDGGTARVTFGYEMTKVSEGLVVYKGTVAWANAGQFRLIGEISLTSGDLPGYGTFTCPAIDELAKCAAIRGTAFLQRWDAVAEEWTAYTGYGVNGKVAFTLTVYDGVSSTDCKGSLRSASCRAVNGDDWAGIQFDALPSFVIRESEPIRLLPPSGRGSITVN